MSLKSITQIHRKVSTLLMLMVGFTSITSLSIQAASPNELTGVKSEISRQKSALTTQQKQLNTLQQSLKSQEIGINQLEREIKQTKTSLTKTNANIKALAKKIDVLALNKDQHSEKLEQLLQTYYVTQRAKSSVNFLTQGVEDDRISQYFQYLAKQRASTITQLEQIVGELEQGEQQLALEKQQITKLLEKQTIKRNQLSKTQSQRKGTVSKIRKSISSDKVYLSELQRNEARLKAEIAKAAKRNSVPMDGLAKQKGKLVWPVKGRVMHSYGSKQTGQIDWKGIVVAASYGQAIKAVYSGTVVFADYLRGYGLVILLDHGKGDMTLYGFNQSLLKKEGDKVTTGESIALAGDTGGQSQPSLYFEIRRNSKTQDPISWLKR